MYLDYFQAEVVPSQKSADIIFERVGDWHLKQNLDGRRLGDYVSTNETIFFIGQTPVNVSDIVRGVWSLPEATDPYGKVTKGGKIDLDLADYAPPPITVYTYFTLQHYFGIFFCVLALQTIVIFIVKCFWSIHFKNLNCLEKLLHSIENSQFPFAVHDWDQEQGSCEDHFYQMKRNRTETLIITMINLGFNLILLFPLAILCKII